MTTKDIVIAVLVVIIVFFVGFTIGAEQGLVQAVTLGLRVVNITLTPQAEAILFSDPMIVERVLDNLERNWSYVNPYENMQGANKWFSKCMFEYSDYDVCYNQVSVKYGEPIDFGR